MGADVSSDELSRNAGTRATSAESRGGSFALGAMSHAFGSDGLAAAQQRYADVVPRKYMTAGIEQMTANAPSAMAAAGISPNSPRSYTWAGQRYVMGTGLGRSKSTYDANPMAGQESD
jgi:hypothetical protein